MNNNLKINPVEEEKKIVTFIQNTLNKTGHQKVVLALSGGIDSATSYFLLKKAITADNIISINLPYFDSKNLELDVTEIINIKNLVDDFKNKLQVNENTDVRIGNIMARVRMIILFDFAKKNNALVAGTENKSEYYLGYFTRFGDEASDFEPIQHLYKNQVYQLAKYLKVPDVILQKKPSADLWVGQSDEEELGFSYDEADPVLYLYFEKKMSIEEIEKQGLKKAKEIINTALKNQFKHEVPYHI